MSMNNRHLKTIVRRPLMAAWGVLSLLAVGSASGATTNFFASNLLPPPNGLYMPPASGVVSFTNSVILSNICQRLCHPSVLPPTPGAPITQGFTATVEMNISLNGGGIWQSAVVTNGSFTFTVGYNSVSGGETLYTNRMTAFRISGGGLPAGVMIHESPTKASAGETRIKPVPGGYMISSFFDIYLEVSTDFGVTWTPASQPLRLELKPDPQLIPPVMAPRTVLPMPNGQDLCPQAWWQLYANGIVVKDVQHKLFTQWMEPPLFGGSQTNTFDSQLDFLLSLNGGLTFTPARAPATMTVSIKNVREFEGRRTYETEITQFDIAGGDLPAGVMIRESPTKASQGGTSSLAGGGGGGAGGGAALSSFFDIFTEVSINSGVSWAAATNGPAHMELGRIAPVNLFTNNLFPQLSGRYVCTQQWSAYYANGIVITNFVNHQFTAAIPPPLPGFATSHTFGSTVEFDISYDGGSTYSHVTAPATDGVQLTGRLGDDGVTEYYDTEMTQLSISGGSLPSNVQIRESPTKASLGRMTSSAVAGGAGGYQIDSFFDIFTEVSTDSGMSWWPSLAGPATVTLEPQPVVPLGITCPQDITVRATSPAGAVVNYPAPTTSGGCPPITVMALPPSGSTFPIGTTTVNCSATDTCGQQAACSFNITVLRQLKKHFFAANLLPPTNSLYAPPETTTITFPGGILLSNIAQRLVSAGVAPPSLGGNVTNSFGSQVEMEVSLDGGLKWQSCVATNAPTQIYLTNNGPDGGDTLYGGQMLQLDLSGGTLPAGVMIRESPTKASAGETRIETIPGGYMIDSFFDIYLEVSTDFGGTWTPASQPLRLELKPDPQLIPPVMAPRTVLPMPNGQDLCPQAWWQLYASGIVIKDVRHKLFTGWMEPPLLGASQTHTFDSQLDFQLSTDGGVTFTAARAPATMTFSINSVRVFQGRSTYDTEVTQLDIAGGDLPVGVMIRESPTKASQGGTSSLAGGGGGGAGGGAALSSFFDIFTEVSTDSGVSWGPATNGPAHMELGRIAPVNLFTNNLFPQLSGRYVCTQQWSAYYANGIVITNFVNHQFTAAIPPPLPGYSTSHTCGSTVEFDISYDGGLTYSHTSAPATDTVQLTCRLGDDGVTEYYDTEMTQLDISGGGLPANVQIRESPTKASLGRTTMTANGTDNDCDSFFDIFTEVSTDGGQSWSPSVAGPMTVVLQPQPVVPLAITCPSNITVRATSPAGAVVNYPAPTTSGGCPPITVTALPPSGSTFPIGTTTVNCSATDTCGQQAACSFNVTVLRQLKKHFFATNLLPPTNSLYVPPETTIIAFPGGILLSNVAQRLVSAGVTPPAGVGSNVTHSFNSQVEMEVSLDGGLTWQSCVATNAPTQIHLVNNGPDGADTLYGAELLQLNLSGGGLPAGVMIRESPTKASAGETRIETIPGGYMIDSFFDIYLEVSTDFGVTWTLASQPLRLELKPDPQLIPPALAPRKVLPMPNGQYTTPGWWQQYASGICIRELRHKLFTQWMEPPVFGASQTHTVDLQMDFQLSTDGGAHFTPARAPATMTVTIGNTRVFQGRSTYDTEVTQLDIAGGDLPVGVMIRESPTKASQGGTSSLAGGGGGGAGGGAAISSFFDIFTEVSTDSGVSWGPATNGPAHEELVRIAPVNLFTNNLFPQLSGRYICTQQWAAYYADGIVITNFVNHQFTAAIPPPLPGYSTSHTCGSTVEFDISYDGGLTYSHVTAPATDGVQLTCRLGDDGVTEYYDTEMTQLDISGGGLPANVQIRESPTKASLGRTTMTANGTDNDCDSFFDIFTEVSTDGGQSWSPSVAGPMTVVLQPQPVVPLPDMPTNVTAIAGDATVYLSWDTVTNATAGYIVKRSTNTNHPYAAIAYVSTTTYTNTTLLTNGVWYYYVVSATNSLYESSNSVPAVVARPLPTNAPPAVLLTGSGFYLDPISGEVKLLFDGMGGIKYRIVYKDDLLTGTWAPLPLTSFTECTNNGTGTMTLIGTNEVGVTQRFYRVESQK